MRTTRRGKREKRGRWRRAKYEEEFCGEMGDLEPSLQSTGGCLWDRILSLQCSGGSS